MPWVLAIAAAAWFAISRTNGGPTRPVALAGPQPAAPLSGGQYQAAVPQGGGQLGAIAGQTGVGVGEAAVNGFVHAGLGGASAAALTGIETAGIGAGVYFAAQGIENVIKCGTLTGEGCDKRSDSALLINIRNAAEEIAYGWESGQISSAAAVQGLQQLQGATSAFKDIQRSWNSASTYYRTCGSFSNNGKPETGAPCGSAAASVLTQGVAYTGPQMLQLYIQFVSQPARTSQGTRVYPDALQAVTA